MNDSILFSKAVHFAAQKHETQTRRDGSPYILHPLKVAEIVRDSGYDIRYQIVALLHDILEDTDATEEELLFFGQDICEAVKLLTRLKGMDEAEYLAKIFDNHMATIVKAADKLHNIWECSHSDNIHWASKYIDKSQKYYRGKFNKAVDDSIQTAKHVISHPYLPRKSFSFNKEDMKLYSEIQQERYNTAKAKYNPLLKPIRDGSERYYKDDAGGFLIIQDNRYFSLAPYGWIELKDNPIFQTPTPYEDYPASNNTAFSAFIARETKNRQYLYDFVEIENL